MPAFMPGILLVLPMLLTGFYWCCLRYFLDPMGAASATSWIILALSPLLPGFYW
jgi:hypothetical protein